jgi:hypothetical protein
MSRSAASRMTYRPGASSREARTPRPVLPKVMRFATTLAPCVPGRSAERGEPGSSQLKIEWWAGEPTRAVKIPESRAGARLPGTQEGGR